MFDNQPRAWRAFLSPFPCAVKSEPDCFKMIARAPEHWEQRFSGTGSAQCTARHTLPPENLLLVNVGFFSGVIVNVLALGQARKKTAILAIADCITQAESHPTISDSLGTLPATLTSPSTTTAGVMKTPCLASSLMSWTYSTSASRPCFFTTS